MATDARPNPALESLQRRLGHRFANPALLQRALTHRSFGAEHNERLEFLGDTVLALAVSELLYERFSGSDEGDLTRVRAHLVREDSLHKAALGLGLPELLRLSEGEARGGGAQRASILADALEAVIGALYLDQGMDVCKQWIKGLFQQKVQALSLDNWQKDPKTQLQELMQSKKIDLPEYTLLTMSGLPHEQTFKVKCTIPLLKDACIGTGVSRKRAEQAAAEKILQLLEKSDQ